MVRLTPFLQLNACSNPLAIINLVEDTEDVSFPGPVEVNFNVKSSITVPGLVQSILPFESISERVCEPISKIDDTGVGFCVQVSLNPEGVPVARTTRRVGFNISPVVFTA